MQRAALLLFFFFKPKPFTLLVNVSVILQLSAALSSRACLPFNALPLAVCLSHAVDFSPHWSTRPPPHTAWTLMCIWLRPIACVDRRIIPSGWRCTVLWGCSCRCVVLSLICPFFSLMPLLLFHCTYLVCFRMVFNISKQTRLWNSMYCKRIIVWVCVCVCVCVRNSLEKVWEIPCRL